MAGIAFSPFFFFQINNNRKNGGGGLLDNQRRPLSFWKLTQDRKDKQGSFAMTLGSTSLYLRARERHELEDK